MGDKILIECIINRRKLIKNLFLDTGSVINCIDENFLKTLLVKMNEYKIQKTKFQIRTANDESVKCQGIISLPIRIGKCEWNEKFFIHEGLAHPIILGSKIMRERGIDIEFTKAKLK